MSSVNLTLEQKAARQYWCDFVSGSMLSYYILARIDEISHRYEEYEFDQIMSELDILLQNLDYNTTMDGATTEFEPTTQFDHRFWTGRYALFDEKNNSYALHVMNDEVRLSC